MDRAGCYESLKQRFGSVTRESRFGDLIAICRTGRRFLVTFVAANGAVAAHLIRPCERKMHASRLCDDPRSGGDVATQPKRGN